VDIVLQTGNNPKRTLRFIMEDDGGVYQEFDLSQAVRSTATQSRAKGHHSEATATLCAHSGPTYVVSQWLQWTGAFCPSLPKSATMLNGQWPMSHVHAAQASNCTMQAPPSSIVLLGDVSREPLRVTLTRWDGAASLRATVHISDFSRVPPFEVDLATLPWCLWYEAPSLQLPPPAPLQLPPLSVPPPSAQDLRLPLCAYALYDAQSGTEGMQASPVLVAAGDQQENAGLSQQMKQLRKDAARVFAFRRAADGAPIAPAPDAPGRAVLADLGTTQARTRELQQHERRA
jgi:hypothetical protein